MHLRFIPACVGNSLQVVSEGMQYAGSSPRVWGTLNWSEDVTGFVRFIPACVGNSYQFYNQALRRFIPACVGNSLRTRAIFHDWTGSSPRVWGTHCPHRLPSRHARFIPACVGNSEAHRKELVSIPVHPRVCGELHTGHIGNPVPHGSSPRVWGTPALCTAAAVSPRFIPACVGNSSGAFGLSDQLPVHPRVCGELTFALTTTNIAAGSSPRVWGTRCVGAKLVWFFRFIPACVGNSEHDR